MESKPLNSGEQSPPQGITGRPLPPNAVHLVRTVQNNTLTLSNMADNKASILMGATFLVFSLAVSRSQSGTMPWSLLVLAAFSFLSSLLAVLAVMPSVRRPKGPTAPNILFFGHFAEMQEKEWADLVIDRLATDETVYRTMLRDIHQNGVVLQQRKYRYLGHAYRCFLLGLGATLAVFAVEFALSR